MIAEETSLVPFGSRGDLGEELTEDTTEQFDWKTANFTTKEFAEISDATSTFIWKTTEDRVSGPNYSHPYWTHRMKWVNMLMEGRIKENSTKNKIIYTTDDGHNLTFKYIINSGLYKFTVCLFEIKLWIYRKQLEGKDYDINFLFKLRAKMSNNKELTEEESKTIAMDFFDGTSMMECLSDFFIILKNNILFKKELEKGGSNKKTKQKKTRQYKQTRKRIYQTKQKRQDKNKRIIKSNYI